MDFFRLSNIRACHFKCTNDFNDRLKNKANSFKKMPFGICYLNLEPNRLLLNIAVQTISDR